MLHSKFHGPCRRLLIIAVSHLMHVAVLTSIMILLGPSKKVMCPVLECPWAKKISYRFGTEMRDVNPDEVLFLHQQIEWYINGYDMEAPYSPEFKMFLVFETSFLNRLGLQAWRVEMNIFHCGLRLAGQPGLICRDSKGHFVILDWKRCKAINYCGFQNECMLYPLCGISQSNFWVYCIQLNLYRHILETEYGMHVSAMYIGASSFSRA